MGRRFSNYPNAIHLSPLQFCPSMPLLGFPVFSLGSSIVLNRYFHISVHSMTIWSVLKLPKIAWPSPFKKREWRLRNFHLQNTPYQNWNICCYVLVLCNWTELRTWSTHVNFCSTFFNFQFGHFCTNLPKECRVLPSKENQLPWSLAVASRPQSALQPSSVDSH